MKKNLALMAISSVSRLAAGLLTASVLARLLGPESFGILMLWMSVSILLAMVVNFGLTPYLLREIGVNPAIGDELMNQVFSGKLLLTAVLLVIVGCGALIAGVSHPLVFFLLFVSALADTYTEFFNAGLRVRDKFASETRMATLTALLHAALVTSVVFFHPQVEAAAFAYAMSRLIVLGMTRQAAGKHLAPLTLVPIRQALSRLRDATKYAVDFGFQSLFGQIDSIVLHHFVGPVAVGLHQAGMRVLMGGLTAAQVMANVFLPKAAARSGDIAGFGAVSTKMQYAYLTIGVVFGMFLAIFAEQIVDVLFGDQYKPLVALFPLFGLLFFVRFAAAAWGVILTALGEQAYRTKATIGHWLIIAALAPFIVAEYGNAGWLLALIFGNLILGGIYAARAVGKVKAPWFTLGATALLGFGFYPFIRLS